ncbi:hypothetical protein [Occultella gossypii]|uniref:Secreted protein n=1 Tax=Occultella gossypii TaxID=2800820 RepID=A0ABS7SCB7_9MICO|nr:hypothetical protein [Occultella gossypii]MBZ2197727.1 hypothetical protein [Occultella gossypii]
MTRRRWLLVAAVLAVVVVIVVLATRGGGASAERSESITQWDADLRSWEQERLAQFGPDGVLVPTPQPLSAVVLGSADAPVLAGAKPGESLDAVNGACTAQASFPEVVRGVPAPPAAPAGLDLEHPDTETVVARFDADRAALAAFVGAVGTDEPQVRQFCGTYPVLVAAHANAATTGPAEANLQLADALATQCYLSGWEPVCAAGADSARDVATAQAGGDAAATDAAAAAADAAHAQATTAVGLGSDRTGTAAALVAILATWDSDTSAALTAFTDALGD